MHYYIFHVFPSFGGPDFSIYAGPNMSWQSDPRNAPAMTLDQANVALEQFKSQPGRFSHELVSWPDAVLRFNHRLRSQLIPDDEPPTLIAPVTTEKET